MTKLFLLSLIIVQKDVAKSSRFLKLKHVPNYIELYEQYMRIPFKNNNFENTLKTTSYSPITIIF